MFTGLVEEMGTVAATRGAGEYRLISLRAPKVAASLQPGDSLSVNGACQTVVRVEGSVVSVEALTETLAKTNLGTLVPGSVANLERPLTPESRFDGHIVQGHVDGQGRVAEIRRAGEGYYLTVALPEELAAGCIPQGSIAVDGVSLTIAKLTDGRVTINVIPTTWRETTLSARSLGDPVNIETDVIGRYVFRYLETAGWREAANPRGAAESPAGGPAADSRPGAGPGSNPGPASPGPTALTAERLAELGFTGGHQ
jgi:riboflavin synthase